MSDAAPPSAPAEAGRALPYGLGLAGRPDWLDLARGGSELTAGNG